MGDELDRLVYEVLSGEDLKILDRLSPAEKKIAWDILLSFKKEGNYSSINNLWELDFETKPPTPTQFLEDPQYMQLVGSDLFPKWREVFLYIFAEDSNIHELILRGSIGSGKTFFSSLCVTYLITWLMCLRSPVATLLDTKSATSSIFLALLSTDKDQLIKNMWATTIKMLRICPFIQSKSHIKYESNYDDMLLRLPKNIILSGGSLTAHILGQNLFSAWMDEANFRRSKEPQEEAYDFYYQIRSRIENRFLRATGKGFIGLISSEGGEGAFLEKHCAEIRDREQKGKKSDSLICQFAEWEIKPLELGPERFRIDIGDNLRTPKILTEDEEERVGAKIISVPEEYRDSAEKELMRFLMDIAGIIPGRAHKYFYNTDSVLRSFKLDNPVLQEEAELGLDTDVEASDYLNENILVVKVQGRRRPKVHPNSARYVHIDLAKNNDAAGFAMCHVGDYSKGGSPVIYIDLAVTFRASPKKPIDYDKILNLIYWFSDAGYNISTVSYDSYQSQHSMNTLDIQGFKVLLRSVDRMKDVGRGMKIQPEYYSFRSILAEDRIQLPDSALLRTEMLNLISIEERPDHEKNYSKDLIDAVVGSVANLVESPENFVAFDEETCFPVWGSMHPTMKDKPPLPVDEKTLIEKHFGISDNFFYDP